MNIKESLLEKRACLGVVGLGYVGLPIAVAFAKKGIRVVGFDISHDKIENLRHGLDITQEISPPILKEVQPYIHFTDNPDNLREAKFIIVAVPTPVDDNRTPDLTSLRESSRLIGKNLSSGSIVVYESTVYPGVTEDVCVPEIEKVSGLSFKKGDFFVGYSPERINPGDKEHTLEKIVKIVSGCSQKVCDEIAGVYKIVVEAGIYPVSSIKVAEAAKVIENTQRDLNIALMNELSIIFNKMDINTEEVLAAADTKWNFLKFYPGLVGGHCIGVDPYYLTSMAEQKGYHPQVILAGRRINDNMGSYIASQTIKEMVKAGKVIRGAKVLILGLTFKENVPDIRNSRVFDIIEELSGYQTDLFVYDPYVKKLSSEVNAKLVSLEEVKDLDVILIATPHAQFKEMPLKEYKKYCKLNNGKPVLVDVRWVYSHQEALQEGFHYWRL